MRKKLNFEFSTFQLLTKRYILQFSFFFFVPCHFFLTRRQQRQIELCLGLESRLSKKKRVESLRPSHLSWYNHTESDATMGIEKITFYISSSPGACTPALFRLAQSFDDEKISFSPWIEKFSFRLRQLRPPECWSCCFNDTKREKGERKCNSQRRAKKTPMKIGKVIIKLAVIIFCVVCARPCFC